MTDLTKATGLLQVGTRYAQDNSKHLQILELLSRQQYSTGFVLMMEHDGKLNGYKDYSFWPRFSQPCQGGDMRKYSSSHGENCTQPHNSRPGDLSQPFPEGKPSAVAVRLFQNNNNESRDRMIEVSFSDASPWKKGFKNSSNVTLYKNAAGHYEGVILKSMDVDPTVFVNLLMFHRSNGGSEFIQLVSAGLSQNEALAFLMLNGVGSIRVLGPTFNYYFPTIFSGRRFFEQNPNDLSGGLWVDGVDYNRTFVMDVFSGKKDEGGLSWIVEMRRILGNKVKPGNVVELDDVVSAAKEFFELSKKEPDGYSTAYVYRNAQGATLPYPRAAMIANPSLKNEVTEDGDVKNKTSIKVKKPKAA